MATDPEPIPVTAETDWPPLLDAAAKAPVLLEHNGEIFRLERDSEDSSDGYVPDPDRVRQVLDQVAGS